MIFNWKADVIGLVTTFILVFIFYLLGPYPYLVFFAPLIGGFVTSYMIGREIIYGMVNGALVGSIGLFLAVFMSFGNFMFLPSGIFASLGLYLVYDEIYILCLIFGAILGLTGGMIASMIKRE